MIYSAMQKIESDQNQGSRPVCIQTCNLTKSYRLYDHAIDRLKESLHPRRKKYHRNFFALKDVSFQIHKGETIGIIGRNGSGKSTLLKIITGVLTPSSGILEVHGRVSALLELGIGFNPDMTGLENIYFSGTVMGLDRAVIENSIDDIVAFADIGEFIHQPVKTYSSGMYVRLAFAVAINVDPDILIVDEALSVGDISFQSKCYQRFNKFKEAGKTIIFVTHALDLVVRYCDRGIVLDGGKMIVDTNPKTAVDVYKRLMVDCYDDDHTHPVCELVDDEDIVNASSSKLLKSDMRINQEALSYGNLKAEIVDYGLLDKGREPCTIMFNDETFFICMTIRFHERIENPIFAYTIKDLKGFEITGTNTNYRGFITGTFESEQECSIEFSQVLNINSGRYTLSLGCTRYEQDDLVVYHRLYDIVLFEVVSDTMIVGQFDLHSQIKLRKRQL
jgi:teichoic acid transport system ATP-binding protein